MCRARWRFLIIILAAALYLTVDAPATASDWEHINGLFGSTGCAARLSGKEVDTMLMLGGTDQLILMAGRSDWRASGPEEISLRIDGFQLDHLQANAFNNLVLLRISDDAVIKRLVAATNLYWSLPTGTYRAEVSGLGEALRWVRNCEAARRFSSSASH